MTAGVHREVNGGCQAKRLICRAMPIFLALATFLLVALVQSALAAPSRIIILRHGEKADAWKLCEIGQQRARALALNYLGKNAAKSLFADGDPPAFFFAITLHTLELATPAVSTWSKPIILFSVVPEANASKEDFTKKLNRRTQEAARNLLANPTLQGKTVVMVWEHKHIANEKLEAKFENEPVTLRQLLKLDILPGVPKTWPGDTYDYIWIVDFPENSNVPSKFSMVKQEFGASFPRVPSNDWGTPNGLDAASGCKVEDEGLGNQPQPSVRSRGSGLSLPGARVISVKRLVSSSSGLSSKKRSWKTARLGLCAMETIAVSGRRSINSR
jgi:hypothetical protein